MFQTLLFQFRIDHFKTKVAWIHHKIQEILLLPSLHLSPPIIMRVNQVVHRSRLGFWYSIQFVYKKLSFEKNYCMKKIKNSRDNLLMQNPSTFKFG